jgi:SAM-dependent methyltransferase
VTDRYYESEHYEAYARIGAAGLDQWNDLFESRAGFEHFPSREFLDHALPANGGGERVLVYGCGTGASACFLAGRGYRVDGIDLVPQAIEIAKGNAELRGLSIGFEVADVCRWGPAEQRYAVVVDDLCLQSIVTDADRATLYSGVRDRLQPDGRYLLVTAMWRRGTDYGDDVVDQATGIVWTPADDGQDGQDVARINGRRYRPHRRHLTPDALRAELMKNGFEVVEQRGPDGGELSCRLAGPRR